MTQGLGYAIANVIVAATNTGLFSATCSILQPTQAPDTAGQVDWTDTTPVAGLQNIPCQFAPESASPPAGYTVTKEQQIDTMGYYHVLLQGYFPAIQQKWRAQIGGVAYDIFTVESDSQQQMTRLAVRRYAI